MADITTDLITDIRNTARPNSARVSSCRATGVTTLACDNLTGWPTASAVHFATYQIDANSDIVAGTQVDWKGIVSANSITNLTLADGTDAGNSVGDVVEMLPTAKWGQDLADALTDEHNRDGTHSDITADSLATDTITEGTAAAGVTIDGLLVKDSKLAEDDSVVTANITAGAVTSPKLAEAFVRGRLQENTTNTAPTGLTLQHGWGVITASAASTQAETVTFPTAFSAIPLVIATGGGGDLMSWISNVDG